MDLNYTYLSLAAVIVSGAILLYENFVAIKEREEGQSEPAHVDYARSVFPLAVILFLIFWLQDLPLLLFLAVVYTGVVALIDLLWLRKRRAEGEQESSNVEYSKSFFPVLLIVFVIRSFIIEPFQIPSESMVPTLEVGDFIVVNKFTYGIRLPVIRTKILDINDPKRGDVMVFFPPNEDRYFIKRVIGLPGDRIVYANKQLTVNGELWPQKFVKADYDHNPDNCERYRNGTNVIVIESIGEIEHETRYCKDFVEPPKEYIVPEGHYFMMGDNRDNSQDSRVWNTVPEERIVGKAFAKWMYWKDKLRSLPSFKRAGFI